MVDVNTNRKTAETEVFPEVASIDTPPVGHIAVANKAGVMTAKTHDETETPLGGGGAPDDATYIVQTPSSDLSNEQALSALATGLVKNTTTTGVLSIAVANTDYLTPDAAVNTLTLNDGSELTIAESGGLGVITVTHTWHTVDTEANAATDDLHTINGLAAGDVCILMASHTNRTVVLKKSGGNITSGNGDDITLDTAATAAFVIGNLAGTGVIAYALHSIPLPIRSGVNLLRGSVDDTKLLAFDIDGFTTGTTRTITVPNADLTMVGEDVTQTLTNKTMDADANTITNIVRYLQQGFTLRWLANDKILVSGGTINHGGKTINKTTGTVLTMGTAGDWIDGASGEAASAFASVYINASGTLKLHDTLPNASSSDTIAQGNKVADMRVNQAGWNGTVGNGLNATSVVYDTDTGEGSITEGMLLGVYSDSIFTTGRGKGSAATASLDDMSFALITAVNTGTNTLTLEAGHQIAINDNDYLIVIENAPVVYRDESGTVWRWLGAMYNNGSSNLDINRIHNRAFYQANEGADYTTTSSSFGNIDGTSFNHDLILTEFADVKSELAASTEHSNAAGLTYIGLVVNGSQQYADDGLIVIRNPDAAGAARQLNISVGFHPIPLLPGTHNFKPQWKTSASTATMHAGAGTATRDTHATFTAYILR